MLTTAPKNTTINQNAQSARALVLALIGASLGVSCGNEQASKGVDRVPTFTERLPARTEIVHLKWTHRDSFGGFEALSESDKKFELSRVAASQLAVAQSLVKEPNSTIVISEGLGYVSHPKEEKLLNGDERTGAQIAAELFPRGLPKSVQELNQRQISFLVSFGGDVVAALLGGPETIYPCCSVGHAQAIEAQRQRILSAKGIESGNVSQNFGQLLADPAYRDITLNQREEALLWALSDAAKNSPTQGRSPRIVVTYGHNHDLSRFAKYGDEVKFTSSAPGHISLARPLSDFSGPQRASQALRSHMTLISQVSMQGVPLCTEDAIAMDVAQSQIAQYLATSGERITFKDWCAFTETQNAVATIRSIDPASVTEDLEFLRSALSDLKVDTERTTALQTWMKENGIDANK